MRAGLTLLTAAASFLGILACGEDAEESSDPRPFAANASHIHGLGVNPADGSLFIATHAGLYRSRQRSTTAEAVGDSTQDTMGFSVAGADHFFGSGHPAPDQQGPPHLGLIESRDSGRTWEEISLAGKADFHVLRYSEGRIYGFNGLTGLLMVSSDAGESWQADSPPTGLLDLAVDPRNPDRAVAVSDFGLIESRNRGKSWDRRSKAIGYLVWPAAKRLFLFDGKAGVSVSGDAGETFRKIGQLPDVPAAVTAASPQELYAATHDGDVLVSANGGATWTKRVGR